MRESRYQRIVELCDAVADLPAALRAERLAALADGSERLEVESLLAHDGPGALDRPLARALGAGQPEATIDQRDVPERIGQYRIKGVLGEGASGLVLRAEQAHPQREVAIKLLRLVGPSMAARDRFRREAEALARLDHPGVCRIYDAGTAPIGGARHSYLVMELVKGAPLVEAAAPLEVRARLQLMIEVCEAVEHAHRRGVIHRDLKPSNILVSLDGEVARARICDFGVARLLRQDDGCTITGQAIGTLAYMSPEQLAGDPEAIDTRSDVYSLGVVLYELLSGQRPIDTGSSSIFEAIRAVRERAPAPIERHDGRFRGDLSLIVATALRKDPEERYGSAGALAEDLRRYLARQPILARKPSVLYCMSRLASRRRGAVAAAAAGLCAVAGGAAFGVAGMVRAHDEAQRAEAFHDEAALAAATVIDELARASSRLGSRQIRAEMLPALGAHIERLLETDPESPALLRAYAATLLALSDLEHEVGRLEASLELRQQALALREGLAAMAPGDPEIAADLSIALVKVGDVIKIAGSAELRQEYYERALAIDERLVAAHPTERRFLDNLAWSYERLGVLAVGAGDLETATLLHEKRLEIVRRLLELFPGDRLARLGEVEGLRLLGALRLQRGDGAGLEQLAAAYRLAGELERDYPQERNIAMGRAVAAKHYAEALVRAGQPEAARPPLREAERSLQRVLEAGPDDDRAAGVLVTCYAQLAAADEQRGDMTGAFAHARRAVAYAEDRWPDGGSGFVREATLVALRMAARTGATIDAERASAYLARARALEARQ
ncbi:MAG: protein kinase [Phycisphaerales bacterium JB039]